MFSFKVFIVAFTLFNFSPEALNEGPVIGKQAPDFTLTDMNGERIHLADYAGTPVMLEWTNHDCPYVRKHYNSGNMQKTQRTLTEDGVIWLSIISSAPGKQGHVTAEKAQQLTASRGAYATTILFDPEGQVGRLYRAKTTPQMFLIGADGVLQYQGAIDDRPSANPLSLEGATNYALAAWEALSTGQAPVETNTTPYGCSVKY